MAQREYEQRYLYEKHKEHEWNSPLELEYTINRDVIKVETEETNFIREYRKEHIAEKDFIDLIKAVKKASKENEVKLNGINKLKEYIQGNYTQYNISFMDYDKKFDVLALLWEQSLNSLKMGISDNVIYNEVLVKEKNALENACNPRSDIVKFERYYNDLKNLLNNLEHENDLITVTVF